MPHSPFTPTHTCTYKLKCNLTTLHTLINASESHLYYLVAYMQTGEVKDRITNLPISSWSALPLLYSYEITASAYFLGPIGKRQTETGVQVMTKTPVSHPQ